MDGFKVKEVTKNYTCCEICGAQFPLEVNPRDLENHLVGHRWSGAGYEDAPGERCERCEHLSVDRPNAYGVIYYVCNNPNFIWKDWDNRTRGQAVAKAGHCNQYKRKE